MKKTLIICFLLNISFVFAQLTYVPDNNFEQKLINLGYDDILDDYVVTANINTVTDLPIGSSFINDLTGIEDFTALTALYCQGNQLSNLDVSQNAALTVLYCNNNQLTNLDFSQNLALLNLYCNNNQLTNIDVSQNTDLTKLYCYNNQLTNLDVSQNTALTELYCYNNQISNLDVSQNTALTILDCGSNQIANLDISQNLALTELMLEVNQLTNIDVTQLTALTILSCGGNQLTNMDVSQNTDLTKLYCHYNQITNLDASQNYNLTHLWCNSNQLTNLNIRSGNNNNIPNVNFNANNNPNLTCIFVDDAVWSTSNWTNIDPASTFVETQAECDALEVDEEIFINDIHVYPNPTNDILNIRFSNGIKSNDVVLYDYLGNAVIRTKISFMDVSKLNFGIYIIRIITEDNEVISKRIIIGDE